MNPISKFFHQLFHPHCADCLTENEVSKICNSCETLKAQLYIANYEKKQLLSSLLEGLVPNKESEIIKEEPVKLDPLKTSLPWKVRQQLLEENSRKEAELLRKIKQEAEIEKLEEKLGVNSTGE